MISVPARVVAMNEEPEKGSNESYHNVVALELVGGDVGHNLSIINADLQFFHLKLRSNFKFW